MYIVIDEISNERVEFNDLVEAQMEAERRLSLHKSGYHLTLAVKPIKDSELIKTSTGFVIRRRLN